MRNFKELIVTAATLALVGCGGGTPDEPNYPANDAGTVNPGGTDSGTTNPPPPPADAGTTLLPVDCSVQYPNPTTTPNRGEMVRSLWENCTPFRYRTGYNVFPTDGHGQVTITYESCAGAGGASDIRVAMQIIKPDQQHLDARLDTGAVVKVDPASFAVAIDRSMQLRGNLPGNPAELAQDEADQTNVIALGVTNRVALLGTVRQALQGGGWLAEQAYVSETAPNREIVQRAWKMTACRLGVPSAP